MKNDVVILLSAFNGSKYILEQLESIKNQESVSINLIIRDDGSTDNTYSIIDSFKESNKDLNITILKGKNVGYVKSFYLLIKYALENVPNIQYFSLADQDDFWMPDKLISALKSIPPSLSHPVLYCSNAMLTDQNLNPIGLYNKRKLKISTKTCLIQNIATGCTTLFNRKTAQLYVDHQIDNISVHDQYLYILCTLFGETIYDEKPHILYRQHGSNQIGKPNLKKRLQVSVNKLFSNSHSLENRAQLILEEFNHNLSGESLKAVKKLALYRTSLFRRMALLFDTGFVYQSLLSNVIFRIKILIGRV